jgi:HK97 gp10 family phage protein
MNVTVNYIVTNDRLPELIAKFPGLVSTVIVKSTEDGQSYAVGFAPVDTGHLAGSIQARFGDYVGIVQTDCSYAGYQEFGTYKMAAQSFMRPAADIVFPEFTSAMEQMVANL